MSVYLLKINNVDITPYIEQGGLKITRNDIDSSNAGRTLDGTMYRGRVTTKKKIEVKCRPLVQLEAQTILNLIEPEYVTVDYVDPRQGLRTGIQFYSNNVPATMLVIDTNDVAHWTDISFPLVER